MAIALVYVFHDRDLNLLNHLLQWASMPLLLVVDPLLSSAGLPETAIPLRNLADAVRTRGWIGVQVFFVLSGFLITTLLLRERERFGRVDLRAFWVRRALRIWPLYFLVVLIGFAVIPMVREAVGLGGAGWDRLGRLPAFLAFLGNWSMAIQGPIPSDSVSVLWSVCVEEQFYLIVPLLVAWLGPRARVPAVVALMAVGVGSRYALAAAGVKDVALQYNSLVHLDTLLAGVLLALLWPGLRRAAGSHWVQRAAVLGGAAVLLWVPLGRGGPWRMATDYVLVWSWGVALVVWGASGRDRRADFLRRPTMVWLGRISYGLYLYHEVAIGISWWLRRATPKFPEKGLVLALLAALLTVGLAAASYYAYERLFLRLKRRWTRVPSRPVDSEEVALSMPPEPAMHPMPTASPAPAPAGP